MASIANIRKQISEHPANAAFTGKGWKPLFTAHQNSKIIVIGQAPGIKAQESMTPWNDASGNRLRQWMGVSREQFYDPRLIALIPMDFYYPGKGSSGDLPPRKDFAELWHPQILREIRDEQLILLIGQYSQRYYLGETAKKNLTETVKHFRDYLPRYFPLPHPSPRNGIWLSRNKWFADKVLGELQHRINTIIN